MKRVKLVVAYDGTNYHGWQLQPGAVTIEQVLNETLTELLGEPIAVIGASRTDSGVHALGNVAVFDTDSPIPPDRIAYALNGKLPEDIVVVKSEEVPGDWHPRHCDSIKTYEYRILNQEMPDPVRRRDTWHVSFPLDVDAMREAAEYLKGEHDFKSFCSAQSEVENTVRTIYELSVEKTGTLITIRVRGSGFLYNMVRIIAGTLIEVGKGKKTPAQVADIIAGAKRKEAGMTAEAKGLIMDEVFY